MPKRLIDGDAMWSSTKLATVQPEWARAEYAWLYCVSGVNGVFQVDARALWVRCYAYARPERSMEDVKTILAAFQKAKLLFVWEQDGKSFGYWTGAEKPGRLPRESWRKRAESRGNLSPDPAPDALKAFIAHTERDESTQEACSEHGSGVLGLGLGLGSGLGKTLLSEEKDSSDAKKTAPRKQTTKQPSVECIRLAALLKSEILRNKADCRITPLQERNWAVTADRMLRLDSRTSERIADLIRWVQRDEFEMANVLSMDKLRERFDALELKRQHAPQSRNSGNGNGPAFTLPANYVPASVKILREQDAREKAAE